MDAIPTLKITKAGVKLYVYCQSLFEYAVNDSFKQISNNYLSTTNTLYI